MKVLVFGASPRTGSLNARLASLAARELAARGANPDLAAFLDFDAPLFSHDLLETSGFPPGVRRFDAHLRSAGAFVIASPEYVFSVPGALKNLLDWSSQDKPLAWSGKPGLLLSASVSSLGGERGLWALRVPLEAMGAHVYPEMFSLPNAAEQFDIGGSLLDATRANALRALVHAFMRFAEKLTA